MPRKPTLKIELLTKTDLTHVVRLTKDYFQELDLVPQFHNLDQDLTSPLSIYVPPRAGFWLGYESGKTPPIGMAGVLPLASRTCELKRLFVEPEARGQGWGRALLQQTLEFARRAEYMEILVALHHGQTAALTLVQHHGFNPCARFNENRQAGIFLSFKLTEEF